MQIFFGGFLLWLNNILHHGNNARLALIGRAIGKLIVLGNGQRLTVLWQRENVCVAVMVGRTKNAKQAHRAQAFQSGQC